VTDGPIEPVSALIVEVPDAEPLVAGWRTAHDRSAALGVPAHVTILFPFLPPDALSAAVLDQIRDLAARQTPFTARFDRVERREDVVWLGVEPEAPFRAMTSAAFQRFPAWPPYGGRFGDVIPHLTIGQGDESTMAGLADALEQELAGRLPVVTSIDALSLFVSGSGHWSRTARFPLGPSPSSGP
jgi:2'-5' RNA ligase